MPKSSNCKAPSPLSRRSFVSAAGVAAVLGTSVAGRRALAEDMPRLSEDDPTAVALKYVHDATTLDASVRPEDRFCYNCALYTGTEDDDWAGCGIFPGKLVANRGWCSAWAPKA